jgi:hypothetical protein
MDEFLSLNDMKSPHGTDYSVARVETSVPNDQIEHFVIAELRDRGVSPVDSLAGALTQSEARKSEAIEADNCGRWTENLQSLVLADHPHQQRHSCLPPDEMSANGGAQSSRQSRNHS